MVHSFTLSSKGLKGALQMQIAEDFTFIVGGHTYLTNRFFAGFISPKIAQMSLSDPFIDKFEININDETHQFTKIINLHKGNPLILSELDAEYFTLIGNKLGNEEIINEGKRIQSERNNFTKENVLQIMQNKAKYDMNYDEELKYVASNFWDFNKDDLKSIDINLLEKIISSKYIKVESESSLFHFVLDVLQNNENAAKILLNYIHYEYLPRSDIAQFLKIIKPEDLTGPIWASLCSRLVNSSDESTINSKSAEMYIPIDSKDPLNGIFTALASKNEGNIHLKKIVEVTASSSEYNLPYYVISSEIQDYWYSQEEKYPWIMFDFREKQIKPTGYTLKTFNCGEGYSHLKNWVVEGLREDGSWDTLDSQTDNQVLNRARASITLDCNATRYYRKLRIRMTGKNHFNGNHLCLQRVEFFGHLLQ